MEPLTETQPHLSVYDLQRPTYFDGSNFKAIATFLKAFVLLHSMGKQYAAEKAAMQIEMKSFIFESTPSR
eukprot:Awhi_evm1s5685